MKKKGGLMMFRIGEFSKMTKTTIKALRYYDEIGLLKPERVDNSTAYRFYTTDQLFRLHRLQSLRQVGLSIDDIRLALSGADWNKCLEKRRVELLEELAQRQDQLSRIDFMLQFKEDFTMRYVATIQDLPACTVYSKRFLAPSYDSYFQLIPAIGKQVSEKYPDLTCTTPEYCYIVYLDGEYKERDIHVEYCEAVTERKPDFDDIVFQEIEPVTVVSVMHKGPYATLGEAYAFTLQWIEENGYQISGYGREQYIDGIWNKEKEADWLTALQFPITKKS